MYVSREDECGKCEKSRVYKSRRRMQVLKKSNVHERKEWMKKVTREEDRGDSEKFFNTPVVSHLLSQR